MSLDVNFARALMADSLAFHIIFALFGVGLPLVFLVFEFIGLRRKDSILIKHAKYISQVSVILVIAGVASGTIISIQMSLMWGNLIKFGGPIMGLAFGWEGYAFMLEAVFLAFYMTTWGKVKGWKHWLIGLPVLLGSLGSAITITLGNAWMQNPGNLDVVNGQVVSNNPLGSLLTKTAFFMTSHSVMGYYLATVLCVLGFYSYYLLKNKSKNKDIKAVKAIRLYLSAISLILIAITAILGHLQTQYLAHSQPRKFSVIESVQQTTTNAPYIIGGRFNSEGKVEGGIRIPNGLSLLTGNNPNTEVKGLNEFPKETWPMLFLNILFEIKMLLVVIITIFPLIFVVLHNKKLNKNMRGKRYKKPMLVALMPLGSLAVVVVILGWMVAEFGRQPFAVNGYLLTSQAFSATENIQHWGYLFPMLYLFLFLITGKALLKLFKSISQAQISKDLM